MPLYMDFHKFPGITIEEAKKAHVADEQIQKKYGVKYLQFWVNEDTGAVFCLVEGPDMLTCESVHQIAHGHIACAMVEVDPNYYALIMGKNNRVDQGLVLHENGSVDPGYRSILAVALQGKASAAGSKNYEYLKAPLKAREAVLQKILKFNGRAIKLTGEDSLLSVFNSAMQAARCAKEIQTELLLQRRNAKGKDIVSFNIGLSAGQPVTENNEFIDVAIRLAKRLSHIAGEDRILASSLIHELCEEPADKEGPAMKSLSANEENFITNLFGIIEAQLSDENFNIEGLGRAVGISRPQLYRKIQGLTGKAPNDLIRGLRMDKALSLLKRKSGNISEIAFDVGFSNPSYFAKCFARKFGCPPSTFLAIASNP